MFVEINVMHKEQNTVILKMVPVSLEIVMEKKDLFVPPLFPAFVEGLVSRNHFMIAIAMMDQSVQMIFVLMVLLYAR